MHENELHIVLVSGIDNEARPIVFAWGFVKEKSVENYKWFLAQFHKQMMKEPDGNFLDT